MFTVKQIMLWITWRRLAILLVLSCTLFCIQILHWLTGYNMTSSKLPCQEQFLLIIKGLLS
ncbi:hypothetical protein LINPERPRIM_LOCUS29039 [Linum perenne]